MLRMCDMLDAVEVQNATFSIPRITILVGFGRQE